MKVISSKLHGVLDYLVGFILILSPWLLGFANDGPEKWIPIFLGAGTLFYSIITKYELGLFKIIPFSTHLAIDALSGIFLAASPWLFGFSDRVTTPHLVFGLLEIIVVILTNKHTSASVVRSR